VNLSRRDVLKVGAGFAFAPMLPRIDDGFRFAFFSDTHVGLASNLDENAAMFAEMRAAAPDFAINGGDVTDYGWAAQYANYRKLIDPLPWRTYHCPGNHDVRWSSLGPAAYKAGTGDPMYQSFDHKGVHFVMLDSTVPLSHWGHFEAEMLRWLDHDLSLIGRETPLFVAFHHWIGREGVMVDNESKLIEKLRPYNLKVLLTGHGHNDLHWTIDGMHATMNKGLYQGSWESISVGDGQISMERHTGQPLKGARTVSQILNVALRPTRSQSPHYRIPLQMAAGASVSAHGYPQFRWDDGKFSSASDTLSDVGLVGGVHRLTLRDSNQNYIEAGSTVVAGTTGDLKETWRTELSGGVMSHIMLDGEMLVVSAMDGSVNRLDPASGKVLWVAKTGGYCHSSPVLIEDKIIVGSADGCAYAFDAKTGGRLWRFATGGPVYSSASFAKGVVCIASGDGSVYGLRPDGGKLWRFDLPAANNAFIQSPAATDSERFFLAAWDKFLYCLDAATGAQVWRGDCVGNRSWAFSPAIGAPCVSDGKVVVPADGNNLVCWDCKSGEKLWDISAPEDKYGYSSPIIHEGRVYVGCLGDLGQAKCVELASGKEVWTAATGSVIYDSGPAIVSDARRVVVGSVCGLLSACDIETGKITGQVMLPAGHLLSTPVGDGSSVFVGSYSNRVFRFDF
jgi:outer membrane protein assembly factor BamB